MFINFDYNGLCITQIRSVNLLDRSIKHQAALAGGWFKSILCLRISRSVLNSPLDIPYNILVFVLLSNIKLMFRYPVFYLHNDTKIY